MRPPGKCCTIPRFGIIPHLKFALNHSDWIIPKSAVPWAGKGERGDGTSRKPRKWIKPGIKPSWISPNKNDLHLDTCPFLANCHPQLNKFHSFIPRQLCQCHSTRSSSSLLFSPPQWIMAQMWDVVLFPGGAVELPCSSFGVFFRLLSFPSMYLLRCTILRSNLTVPCCVYL